MYMIIIGGGRVGYYLTKALLDEGHEVLVIDKSARVCEIISDELGSIAMRGDGCEAATLGLAGTGRADMLIAVTGEDEDNLVSCQVAKCKFNVPQTIARIRNPQNEALFKKLGIDVTISSTNVILERITGEVPTHPLTHLREIRDKGMEIVEIRIPPDSPTIGKSIKELSVPAESVISLIIRKTRKPVIPTVNTVLKADDQIIAVTPHEAEETLRYTLRGTEP